MFKRIVYHWTAGNYSPCMTDLEHYHFIIDKEGKVYKGVYKPEDNLNCKDGKYAAHTGGGNTGAIGIAVACRKSPALPPTKEQIEKMCKLGAKLSIKYNIPLENIITHAEFSPNRKIDINSIPYLNLTGIKPCGDYLRKLTKECIEMDKNG
ncbi:MAG: peptidoglycan recognition protein family protein [Candidatus Gastranaerophilales bacterium]|nr:peptidoglycan recognition protein family protein [Candidatus Gastranaerophilales bacterium]